ncbi:MAG: PHP domain-containing protein [Bacillota bacterium]
MVEVGWADLHVHTTASDGYLTPEETVELAASIGLKAVAVADHDSISGVGAAMARAAQIGGIQVIPAVELSCEWNETDVHVLGYFIPIGDKQVQQFFDRLVCARVKRMEKMVSRLRGLGIPITLEEAIKEAGNGSPGRPHVARLLARKGFASSEAEAFASYLQRGKPAYVERYKIRPEEAVEAILGWGGVPVLAHPGLGPIPEHLIRRLVVSGLRGLEVKHPSHSEEDVYRYCCLATQLGLLLSGGSDSHGPQGEYGNEVGDVKVPLEWAQRIAQEAHAIRERGKSGREAWNPK